METSYKFWFITRDDDGFIIKCAVKFFEGETSEQEDDTPLGPQTLTRYRASKELQGADLPHFINREKMLDMRGMETVVFTYVDFGAIKEEVELRAYLNGQLQLDAARAAVISQQETDVAQLRLLRGE